jgi:hypothetical protein
MDEREANYPERRQGNWANRFQHFSVDDSVITNHPLHAEPGDYYRDVNIVPDYVLTDKRLKNFLRRNNVRLDDYGIQDIRIDRAEFLRKDLQKRYKKVNYKSC